MALLYGRAGCLTALFGGFRPGQSPWKRQPTSGSAPAARMGHVAVLKPGAGLMYVVAGQTCNNCSNCYQVAFSHPPAAPTAN
jgi:hypothetical protein